MSKDILEDLFKRMPNEQLSDSFKDNLMLLIDKGSVKIDKKISILCLISIIVASIILVAMAIYMSTYFLDEETINSIFSVFQMDLQIENSFNLKLVDYDLTKFRIPASIGGMILLLLFGDYWMRSYFIKKNIKL